MTVRVHGKNMQVGPDMREFAEERVGRAGRIFDSGGDVDVEFTRNSNPRRADGKYRVEITTNAASQIIRAEAEAAEERTAVDLASDRYERKLRKLKTRLFNRNRNPNKALNNVSGQSDDDEEDQGAEIVKTKRFSMKPMSPEEAVLQMDMLGHEFFFFLHADIDRHCVVYRRRDGNVGLIEPE
ncbi:MAG: ribosome-associated translation inhibitor RaiA [Acidimicrobiia bacterium]